MYICICLNELSDLTLKVAMGYTVATASLALQPLQRPDIPIAIHQLVHLLELEAVGTGRPDVRKRTEVPL